MKTDFTGKKLLLAEENELNRENAVEKMRHALRAGLDGHIAKSIDISKLMDILKNFLM